jgi:hypothetical protein
MTKKQIPPKKVVIKDFDGDNVPDDFEFPSIGIEDIDRTLFNLFDDVLDFQVTSKGKTIDVPVIFATGERFALTRRKVPLRDRNNTNILPLISIVRNNFDIGPQQNGKGTAIAFRAQPNYTIKHRLSEKDRSFQNIINKQNLKNQKNVSSNSSFLDVSNKIGVSPDNVGSRRNLKNLKFSKNAQISLKPDINTNLYEIIQLPYPYFISTTYNITFWCQYLVQANQMIEYFLTKIQVPGGEFSITTDNGYELVAFIGNNINFENNFDNMTEDERIIKYSFDVTIPGYILNANAPGLPKQLRSFYSAPTIDFSYLTSNEDIRLDYQPETKKEKIERHVLTDLINVEEYKNQKGESNEVIETYVKNPFTNSEEPEFLRVKNTNSRTGESVISQRIIKEIDRQYE